MLKKFLSVTMSLFLALSVAVAKQSETARPGQAAVTAAAAGAAAPAGRQAAPPPQPFSEEETAALEASAEEPGPDVAGGALSNLHLTYAVIALGAIVLVLIAK